MAYNKHFTILTNLALFACMDTLFHAAFLLLSLCKRPNLCHVKTLLAVIVWCEWGSDKCDFLVGSIAVARYSKNPYHRPNSYLYISTPFISPTPMLFLVETSRTTVQSE